MKEASELPSDHGERDQQGDEEQAPELVPDHKGTKLGQMLPLQGLAIPLIGIARGLLHLSSCAADGAVPARLATDSP